MQQREAFNMLTFGLRNIIVYTEDHNDLLLPYVDKLIKDINDIFDKAHVNLTNNTLDGINYSLCMISQKSWLYMISDEKRDDNPVLLIYDRINKEFTRYVHLSELALFKDESYLYLLEDKVKKIGTEEFKQLQTEDFERVILDALERE